MKLEILVGDIHKILITGTEVQKIVEAFVLLGQLWFYFLTIQ